MSEDHPTATAKPSKPRLDFPLFPHVTGRWAKKIRGRMVYFGPWAEPDGALDNYLKQKDDLHAGRKPRPDPEAHTVKELANSFLNHKKALLDASELSPRTWADYKAATDLLVGRFGKHRVVTDLGPDDFAGLRNGMAKKWGPVRVRDFVQRVRSVFKYALEAGLIDKPMRFGPGFARPSKKTIRLERARKGPKMFEGDELRKMLDAAGTPLRAMILLGVNCGLGNADCGTLPLWAVNLDIRWLDFPRPKPGIPRRCPLWPETVEALKEPLANRPAPKDPADAGLVFLTRRGHSWHKKVEDNPVSKEMRKLLDALGINGCRSFYALRHTFETVGGEAKNQVAVDHIMGHAREDMASVYRERISDDRLRAVADYVRTWLWPPAGSPGGTAGLAIKGP
jgi:integrase